MTACPAIDPVGPDNPGIDVPPKSVVAYTPGYSLTGCLPEPAAAGAPYGAEDHPEAQLGFCPVRFDD